MKHPGTTPPFRGPDGGVLPGSIADISYIPLGGVDQWVMIRGENVANPVLVLLHGGPGFPEMRLFRHFNADLEQVFTVVYWDQRGTDKSFTPAISRASMTVEQFLRDLDELVDHVRARFGKDKVTLYGHSWGSALGVMYAARFPEKVAAYVGAGQVGNWPASELRSYGFTLAEAERRNEHTAVRQLRGIGPPPYRGKRLRIQRQWLARFVGVVRGMSLLRFFLILLGGPEASILDLPNILRGVTFSECLWPEASSLNLVKAVPSLEMPVFFFIGRHDHVIDAGESAAYFDVLTAPAKILVWFEESAHEPPAEEPAKFHRLMVELVRPVSSSSLVSSA